jgi:hypothetical protein
MLDPKLEARRKYVREYKQKRRRELEGYREIEVAQGRKYRETRISTDPAWAEAMRKNDRERVQRLIRENPQLRGRMRFYDWVS